MASKMKREFQANKEEVKDQEEKTRGGLLDEPIKNNDNTEASEESEFERPKTGIQPETLIYIDNETEDD